MGARAEALAGQFETRAREAAQVLERLSEAEWKKITEAEKWSVGVTAHHLAASYERVPDIATGLAAGQSFGNFTRKMLDERNAQHAREFAGCTKQETLALHRKGAAKAAAVVRGFTDEQLAKSGVLFTDAPPMTVEQLIMGALIHHTDEHYGSIRKTIGNSVAFHRVLRAAPEKVYRAFLDAGALAKWLPPHGFTCTVHHLDAKVGGTYRMSFTNFTTGGSHAFGGEYLELVPHERIRHTDRFEDPNLPGEMVTTITLKAVSVGTELSVVQEGLPAMIPPEACYLGWQESLTLLTYLVEAEIPD